MGSQATCGCDCGVVIDASEIDVNCVGDASGSATASAVGGSGDYVYAWSDGQTSSTASGLVAGDYSVTVTDQGTDCVVTASVTVSEPELAFTSSVSVNNGVSCNGDS